MEDKKTFPKKTTVRKYFTSYPATNEMQKKLLFITEAIDHALLVLGQSKEKGVKKRIIGIAVNELLQAKEEIKILYNRDYENKKTLQDKDEQIEKLLKELQELDMQFSLVKSILRIKNKLWNLFKKKNDAE